MVVKEKAGEKKIINERNYPLTGEREIADGVDVTPEIHYRDRIAVKFTTYCWVNGYSLSSSDYAMTEKGFTEKHFDEHHGIYGGDNVVSKSRLEMHDDNNPKFVPVLEVLGSTREEIEKLLNERRLSAYHVSAKV